MATYRLTFVESPFGARYAFLWHVWNPAGEHFCGVLTCPWAGRPGYLRFCTKFIPTLIEDTDPHLLDIMLSAKIRSCCGCDRAHGYLHLCIDACCIDKKCSSMGTLRRYLYPPSDLDREEDEWWRLAHVPTDKLRAFKSAYLLASSPADFNDYEKFSLILPDKFYGMLGFPSSKPCIRLAVMVSVRRLKKRP